MKLMLDVDMESPRELITYSDKIFLIGSCFTEHIGKRLEELKFGVLQNPNGILFDPVSVCTSLNSYIDQKVYEQRDLFFLNELWQSWNHHSSFSGLRMIDVLEKINLSQQHAYDHLKEAKWLIMTLGSSFSYRLFESEQSVANCHRAPQQLFDKHMLTIEETVAALEETISKLKAFNPQLNIIFTVSPVRHIRDGVVHNNRSKARLLEAVHSLVERHEHAHYFPAYELVIDVLRDYRFYDIDLVHPNYSATEFVFNKFLETFIDPTTQKWMEEIKKITTSYKHRPFQPDTQSHREFLRSNFEKVKTLQDKLPHLDFSKELIYFSTLSPVTSAIKAEA